MSATVTQINDIIALIDANTAFVNPVLTDLNSVSTSASNKKSEIIPPYEFWTTQDANDIIEDLDDIIATVNTLTAYTNNLTDTTPDSSYPSSTTYRNTIATAFLLDSLTYSEDEAFKILNDIPTVSSAVVSYINSIAVDSSNPSTVKSTLINHNNSLIALQTQSENLYDDATTLVAKMTRAYSAISSFDEYGQTGEYGGTLSSGLITILQGIS